jgi:MoxR-like ATPase
MLRAAKANAFLGGAPAVYPDHVQAVFAAVMRHRILSEQDFDPLEIIAMALANTPVP